MQAYEGLVTAQLPVRHPARDEVRHKAVTRDVTCDAVRGVCEVCAPHPQCKVSTSLGASHLCSAHARGAPWNNLASDVCRNTHLRSLRRGHQQAHQQREESSCQAVPALPLRTLQPRTEHAHGSAVSGGPGDGRATQSGGGRRAAAHVTTDVRQKVSPSPLRTPCRCGERAARAAAAWCSATVRAQLLLGVARAAAELCRAVCVLLLHTRVAQNCGRCQQTVPLAGGRHAVEEGGTPGGVAAVFGPQRQAMGWRKPSAEAALLATGAAAADSGMWGWSARAGAPGRGYFRATWDGRCESLSGGENRIFPLSPPSAEGFCQVVKESAGGGRRGGRDCDPAMSALLLKANAALLRTNQLISSVEEKPA